MIIFISSFNVDEEVSVRGSDSESEDEEATDSSGFLKLSTVSQKCTSSDRPRLSMNSMKYDKELGFVRISLSLNDDDDRLS